MICWVILDVEPTIKRLILINIILPDQSRKENHIIVLTLTQNSNSEEREVIFLFHEG